MKHRSTLSLLLLLSNISHYTLSRDILNVPGTYVYGNDIAYLPTGPDDAIIEIASSNITLEFDGHAIYQDPSDSTPGLIGVLVDPNLYNVIIRNGVIRNVDTGIVVQEGSQIAIENMTVYQCSHRGIDLQGTSLNPINNSLIQTSALVGCASANDADSVMTMSGCNNMKMINCSFKANGGASNTIDVLRLENCEASEFLNIDIKGTTGASLNGCHLVTSHRNIFENLRVMGNIAYNGDLCCIMSDTLCEANTFFSCGCNSNIVTSTSGAELCGFLLDGNSAYALQECEARNNEGLGNSINVYGFNIQNSDTICLKKCVASNNKQRAFPGNVYGFYVANNNQCSFDQIIADSNGSLAEAYGFMLNSCNNCHIKEGRFSFNQGDTTSRGMKIISSPNHVATGNIAFSNGLTAAEQIDGLSSLEVSDLNTSVANLATITYPWINIRAYNP